MTRASGASAAVATVLLRSASGCVLSEWTVVTAANLHDYAPDPLVAETVRSWFEWAGFGAGIVVGVGFSASASIDVFERVFGVKLERWDAVGVRLAASGASDRYVLPLDQLPSEVWAAVLAVTFEPPPEFGPGTEAYSSECLAPDPQGSLSVPAAIRNSSLYLRGGFDVAEGVLAGEELRAMTAEAQAAYAQSERHDVDRDEAAEVRGGAPARKFRSAPGGPVQRAFYSEPAVLRALVGWAGVDLQPLGAGGTFTYYEQAGDHLALHRDVVGCDAALITALGHDGVATDRHGALELYPERCDEPISAIRATPLEGATRVVLEVGQSSLFFGGYIAHRLVPIAYGQRRVISVLCYRVR